MGIRDIIKPPNLRMIDNGYFGSIVIGEGLMVKMSIMIWMYFMET